MDSRDEPNPGEPDSWAWAEPPRPRPPLHAVPGIDPGLDLDLETGVDPRPDPVGEGRWLVAVPSSPDRPDTAVEPAGLDRSGYVVPGRVWAGLAAVVAVMVGVVAVWANASRDDTTPALPVTPVSATSVVEGACNGLTGTLVTDRPGDPATLVGVIAAFEAAYYLERSAEAAMRVLAPESGIAAEGLAAGIASIPAGTTHCVAVTPISVSTANVHVVELHPDHQRLDYLQVINTRPADTGGLVISNVQRQG